MEQIKEWPLDFKTGEPITKYECLECGEEFVSAKCVGGGEMEDGTALDYEYVCPACGTENFEAVDWNKRVAEMNEERGHVEAAGVTNHA